MEYLCKIERDEHGRISSVRSDFWVMVLVFALLITVACKTLG